MNNMNDSMTMPYTIELIREDATTWFARVAELPGCITEGEQRRRCRRHDSRCDGWLDRVGVGRWSRHSRTKVVDQLSSKLSRQGYA